MRKSLLIGTLAVVMLATGLTVAWVNAPDGQLTVASSVAVAQTVETNQAITNSGSAAVKAAIQRAGPAVVRIDVTGTVTVSDTFSDLFDDEFFRRFFQFDETPEEQETASLGSGVVFEYAGEKLVLTNEHVIDDADTIELTDINGNVYSASVIGTDDLLDVAILRVDGDASALVAATLGDSDAIEIGDWAIAIGNPLGLSYTVTMGIISAVDRDIAKPSGVGTYWDLIQTDAAINPGNSGGPLVNAAGEVIGINTLIARTSAAGVSIEGINFAIALNGVLDILDQLVETGAVSRGWLGVQVADVTVDTVESFGVDPDTPGAVIAHVFSGDPADVAGIEVGDVVTRIDDVAIASSDDLVSEIAKAGAGTQVEIEVVRDGEALVFDVTLGERPSEDVLATYEGQTSEETTESAVAFGLTVGSITPIVAEHLGLNSSDGVVIMDVAAGSRASSAGLAEGDIIVEIDHEPIASVEEWNDAITDLGEDSSVTFTVIRDGQLLFVTV